MIKHSSKLDVAYKLAKTIDSSSLSKAYKIPLWVAATATGLTAEIPEKYYPFSDPDKYPVLSNFRGVPSLTRAVSKNVSGKIAQGFNEGFSNKVFNEIDKRVNTVADKLKPNDDTGKVWKKMFDTIGESARQMTDKVGTGIGAGISDVFEPTVKMLGVSGLGAGLGGLTTYAIARQLTRNRLLRTLATIAGAGAGALGGYELNNKVLNKYVWGSAKARTKDSTKSKDNDKSKDKVKSKDTDKSGDKSSGEGSNK